MGQTAGKKVAQRLGKSGQTVSLDPLETLREYVKYKTAAEAEATRREEIRARRDIAVTAIRSQRQLIERYGAQR
jgi:hypothetical protein